MYLCLRNHRYRNHQTIGLEGHTDEADGEWSPAYTGSPRGTSMRRIAATESGQTTAEYALVLLAAGSIAMLVVGWAQGNDAIGALFDTVLSKITSLMA